MGAVGRVVQYLNDAPVVDQTGLEGEVGFQHTLHVPRRAGDERFGFDYDLRRCRETTGAQA